MNKLPIALAYLGRGYSVLPVGADKRPLVSWKIYQTQKPTPEELVKWFTDFPDAQIGIITGAISNLTVIDVESDGDLDFIKDKTYTVQTGGGGRHYYFTYDSDFKNAVKILPSVDVRSEGGYVVAAGSQTQKGSYETLLDVGVTQMSENTKKSLLGASRAFLERSTQGLDHQKTVLPWYAASTSSLYPKITAGSLEYQGAKQGGRNDAMTKFAGSIMARLHPSLWGSIGWGIFEEANQKNIPPLPISELRATWISISNKETKANPDGRRYDFPQEKRWGPVPEKKQDATQPDESSADSIETLHVSDVAASQIIDTDNTFPIDMPPFDEALLGGFSLGDVVVVAGNSGEGKTTIIQDWTVTLASGGQAKKSQLPVLWFSYEVLAKPLWQKFQLMGASAETPIYMPRFNETGEIDWIKDVIEEAIEKWGIKVVAIDHLGFLRAPRGNYSNAADAITHTVRLLKKIAVKRGLIILLPVHVRKTSSKTPNLNDIRDSLGIAQEADTVFFIGREKDDLGMLTQQAKLWLVKNRKTGISVSAMFNFQFGRYFYNAPEGSKPETESDSLPDW